MTLDGSTITLIVSGAVLVIGALTTACVKIIAALSESKVALATITRAQEENTAKLSAIHEDTADAGRQNAQIITQTNGHLSDLTDRLAEQTKRSAALQTALDSVLEFLRTQQIVRAAAVVPAVVAVPPREVRATDKPADKPKGGP